MFPGPPYSDHTCGLFDQGAHTGIVCHLSAGKTEISGGVGLTIALPICATITDISRSDVVAQSAERDHQNATEWVIEKGSSFLINLPCLFVNLFTVFLPYSFS